MFKKKNYLTQSVLLSILLNTKVTVYYNNIYNSNIISLLNQKNTKIKLNYYNEYNKLTAIDIIGVNLSDYIYSNNLFYLYSWDFYINFINLKNKQITLSKQFYNRVWLERETMEFFNIQFLYLNDARNLLLNYNENKFYLTKKNSVQSFDEIKTSWHKRKIFKKINFNVEI